MGRKKKPDKSKVLQGTFRKDRSQKKVNPDFEGLQPPVWLLPAALPYFEEIQARMEAIGLNSSTFSETVALAAMRAEEIARCDRDIKRKGMSSKIEGVSGTYYRPNPAVQQRSNALRHLQHLYQVLCLTPSDLSKAPAKKEVAEVKGFGAL